MDKRGLVLVNTGDGKGKTTAALGTALRAVGNGFKVLILQFIKGNWDYGEKHSIESLGENIELRPMGKGFVRHNQDANPEKEAMHKKSAEEAWQMVKDEVASDKWDLIILDEVNYAVKYDLLDVADVVTLIKSKPERLHMILTGRDARQEIIDLADTVTEMKIVKHAYQKGVKATRGIEF